MLAGWSAACCANFLGGLIEVVGAFIAPMITRNVPKGAFLVPIGGVGITWLGYGPIVSLMGSHQAHFPIVGFLPFLLIFTSFYGMPGSRVPWVGVAAILGVILFLIVNANGYAQGYETGAASVGNGGLAVPDFGQFSTIASNAGLVIGLACTNFIGTFACNISARLGGDSYSPMESMIVDGLGSMIGALFGSPYGTTVYIGHTTYKKFGGTRGYSFVNGVAYFIIGLVGLHGIIDAILPHEIVLGVLVCIGFTMAAQCVEAVPKRWYPAVLIGLAICFSDYMGVNGAATAVPDISIFQNGYIFVSCLYTFLLMMITDRWFMTAGVVLLVMCVLTVCGIMHAGAIGFVYDSDGHHIAAPAGTTTTYKILVTYAVSGVAMFAMAGVQKLGKIDPPQNEDNFREIQKDEFSTKDEFSNAAPVKASSAEGGAVASA